MHMTILMNSEQMLLPDVGVTCPDSHGLHPAAAAAGNPGTNHISGQPKTRGECEPHL
jgi:hypothetical protein